MKTKKKAPVRQYTAPRYTVEKRLAMQLLNDEEVPSVSPQCLLRALVLLQRQLTSISSQRDARELLPDTVLKRWNIDSLLPV